MTPPTITSDTELLRQMRAEMLIGADGQPLALRLSTLQ